MNTSSYKYKHMMNSPWKNPVNVKNITRNISSFLLALSPIVIFYLVWFFPLQKQELISNFLVSFSLATLLILLKWYLSKKKIFPFSLLTATTYLAYTVRSIDIDYNLGRLDVNADSLWLGYMQVLMNSVIIFIIIYLVLKILLKGFFIYTGISLMLLAWLYVLYAYMFLRISEPEARTIALDVIKKNYSTICGGNFEKYLTLRVISPDAKFGFYSDNGICTVFVDVSDYWSYEKWIISNIEDYWSGSINSPESNNP